MYGVARLGYKYEMGEEIGVGMIISCNMWRGLQYPEWGS